MTAAPFLQRLARKLDKTLASWFFIDQWIILTARHSSYHALDWHDFQALIPPRDRYWGDPFVIRREGCDHVFLEEKLYATGLGRIVCLTLDPAGGIASQQVVLERPYHLSYPFIFEHAGELFMIPETAGNRTVELYRCTDFPDQWMFVKNLLTDIYAVDSTLLEHAGRLWLFTNVKTPGGSSLDSLYVYHAADFLNGEWLSHPRNPVVKDIHSARPAGRIFLQEGNLVRPSQDSYRRYGYALNFNIITTLNETEYAETLRSSFTPQGSQYRATHTFNQAGDLTVIDAVLRRPR